MDVIIVLIIASIGTAFSETDFFVLQCCLSTALSLYRIWIDYTNDKTARR